MGNTRALLVSLGLGLPLLGGCSLFVPKLQKPDLSVVSVKLRKSDLVHQEIRVRMRVQNPNDRVLPVKSITYQIEVGGEEFAHGMSAESFEVPALGEAEFDVNMTANMAGMLVKLLSQGSNKVEYHITGKVSLSSGLLRSLAFSDHGTFRWQ